MTRCNALNMMALVLTGLALTCVARYVGGEPSPQPVSPNILSNSGFENGKLAWTTWNRPGDVNHVTFEMKQGFHYYAK